MAYEIISWLFDDNLKFDSDYVGILTKPHTKFQDVSEQLQELRLKGIQKGDNRIDSFLNKVDVFARVTPFDISDNIETNNENWRQTLLSDVDKAKSQDDIGTVRQEFDAQKDKYEDATMNDVENAIITKETELAGIGPGVIKEIEKQIEKAKTFEDIQKIPLEDLPAGPERTRLAEEIKEQQAKPEFVTQEEFVETDILGQIGKVTTVDQLQKIDAGEGITSASRDILRKAIEEKRGELEG